MSKKSKFTEEEKYQRRLEASRRWKERNREHIRLYNASRKDIKRDWMRERRKDLSFRKLESKRHNIYHKKRIKKDLNYFLRHKLRTRINASVANGQMKKRLVSCSELLGAPIEIVRKHIEKQFHDGMSWENYGLHGWHIDHIRPVASFDLTKIEEQKKCFHYTNLQPLYAKDNLAKRKQDKGIVWSV